MLDLVPFVTEIGAAPGRYPADQPFLYLIRHEASGLVLFAGQIVDPT